MAALRSGSGDERRAIAVDRAAEVDQWNQRADPPREPAERHRGDAAGGGLRHVRADFRILERALDVDGAAQCGEAEAFRLRDKREIERFAREIERACSRYH